MSKRSKKGIMICCKPGSLIPGVPIRLNNINVTTERYTCHDEEYELPLDYTIKRHDVLFGNMKGPGNERLRVIAEMRVIQYMNASNRKEKARIINDIVAAVREAGGNFVRKGRPTTQMNQNNNHNDDDDTMMNITVHRWYDVGNFKAREKSSHMLRLCAATMMVPPNLYTVVSSCSIHCDDLFADDDVMLEQQHNKKRQIQSVTLNNDVQPTIDTCLPKISSLENLDEVSCNTQCKKMKYDTDQHSIQINDNFQTTIQTSILNDFNKSILCSQHDYLGPQWCTTSSTQSLLSLEDVMRYNVSSSILPSKKIYDDDMDDISVILPEVLLPYDNVQSLPDSLLLPGVVDDF